MKTLTLPIYNSDGKEVDELKVDGALFGDTPNTKVLYQAVNAFRANQRKGLAATKTRGEISGGGKKPWKQKGTGRARAGSNRSPLWYHGGVVFGPHPRDFSFTVPRRIKLEGLRAALSAKIKENNLVVLDDLKIMEPKTKAGLQLFANLKLDGGESVLLLSDALNKNARLALRNIKFLDINLAKDTNAYEVLAHRKVMVTRAGIAAILNRMKK